MRAPPPPEVPEVPEEVPPPSPEVPEGGPLAKKEEKKKKCSTDKALYIYICTSVLLCIYMHKLKVFLTLKWILSHVNLVRSLKHKRYYNYDHKMLSQMLSHMLWYHCPRVEHGIYMYIYEATLTWKPRHHCDGSDSETIVKGARSKTAPRLATLRHPNSISNGV